MKKLLLLFSIILFSGKVFSQTDYSGRYGFQSEIFVSKDSEMKPGKDESGKSGDLTLLRIDSTKYKFWLFASRGWPSYNSGEISGFINVKNGHAEFSNKIEYAEGVCKIRFTVSANKIVVEQLSTDMDCGFGMAVIADGDYAKRKSGKINNAELEKMNPGFGRYLVNTAKAYLYEDKMGSKIKKQYFVNGDKLIAADVNDNFIYVEYITASGKFIYGWIKISDVKLLK